MKNVAVSLMAIFFAACSGNKSPHSLQQEKEDLSAKGLLQGIWLDDETESPLMRVEGDTIYYACLLYTSPSPRDGLLSRMPSSA